MIENLELKKNLNKLKQDNAKLTREHKRPKIVSVLSEDDTDTNNTNKNNNNDTDTSDDNNEHDDTVSPTEEGEIKGYDWYIDQLAEIKNKKDFKNDSILIAKIGRSPKHFKLALKHLDLLPPNKKTRVTRGRSIDIITAYCLETFTDAQTLLDKYGTET
jgi:hypothetical protein